MSKEPWYKGWWVWPIAAALILLAYKYRAALASLEIVKKIRG